MPEIDDGLMQPFRGTRPVPDPTALTNELVEKATKSLGDRLDARINGIEDRIGIVDANMTRHVDVAIQTLEQLENAKIISNTEALNVLRQDCSKRLADGMTALFKVEEGVKDSIVAAKVLLDEKIRALTETVAVFKTSVDARFQISVDQTEKAARDVKSAVDAAFAAAKESGGERNTANALSIAKSEVATTKQIDQITENLRLSVKTTDDKIGDIKDRIVSIESRSGQNKDNTAFTLALASLMIAVIAIIAAIFVGVEFRR